MNRQGTEDFTDSENTLYDSIMMNVIIPLSNPTERTTPRVNHNVNHNGFGVMMMCQCRFINCNKCTTLVGDGNNGGGCASVVAKRIWEISVLSSQFC